jgi:Kef-type K+ transport system membrane component KefB
VPEGLSASHERSARPPRSVGWWLGGYALAAAAVAGVFWLIALAGGGLESPAAAAAATGPADRPAGGLLLRVLVALAAVIVTGQVLARVFAMLGQPPVIGEVVAGIVLGPSVLGPDWSALVLPPAAAPALGVIAQLGVVLYMFLVGLELNADLLRHHVRATAVIAHVGIAVPFVLGGLFALVLYPRVAGPDVPFLGFALFVGVALAITAFPVLARILADGGLTRTELGQIALACAATGDVTAWCLLAVVVGVVQAQVGTGLLVVAGAAGYVGLMALAARPFLVRLAARAPEPGRGLVAAVLLALLLSALATEALGLHAIFGAFLLGAVIPHDSGLARRLTAQLEHLVTTLFLPAFFAYTGMRTRIGLVSGWEEWLLCLLIIAAATAGKVGGTLAGSRLMGLSWPDAAALSVLMNTRGLMELIVLNVGLDLGVISPPLFAMMVVMALVTTLATAPGLRLLERLGFFGHAGPFRRSTPAPPPVGVAVHTQA